ncbi:MAG: hypothetical protein ACOCWZ_09950 [Spirochaetota bacterium]
MSLKGDHAILEYVVKLLDDIHFIIERHGDTATALKDTEGYHALMMLEYTSSLSFPRRRESIQLYKPVKYINPTGISYLNYLYFSLGNSTFPTAFHE